MKTIDSLIHFFDRLGTPRIIDTQIEKRLLNLANKGDRDAARHYADLSLARMSWERTGYSEHWQDFVDEAHDAQAWLASIPSETTTI